MESNTKVCVVFRKTPNVRKKLIGVYVGSKEATAAVFPKPEGEDYFIIRETTVIAPVSVKKSKAA